MKIKELKTRRFSKERGNLDIISNFIKILTRRTIDRRTIDLSDYRPDPVLLPMNNNYKVRIKTKELKLELRVRISVL